MRALPKEAKDKVLELLRKSRSLNEISARTGVTPGTIEDWASNWRKDGTLTAYVRKGAAFTQKAKLLSKGYYPRIRKRYHTIKRLDKLENREFGFNSPVEAIPYFLDENGNPRSCAYCGAIPPKGRVWGLDRLDSSKGHIPRNLVPCCGQTAHGSQMSCQASKSKYDLRGWMAMNMSRTFGRPATTQEVEERVARVEQLATDLAGRVSPSGTE